MIRRYVISTACALLVGVQLVAAEHKQLTPNQVQFAFDIHDTITEKNEQGALRAIGCKGVAGLVYFGALLYPEKVYRLAGCISAATIGGLWYAGKVNPWVALAGALVSAYGICKERIDGLLGMQKEHRKPIDGSVEALLAAYPHIAQSSFARNAALDFADRRHKITVPMQNFLIDLAADKGYSVQVLSNMGPINWERMKQAYPHLFNERVITGGTIIDYNAGNKVKPHPEPFDRFETSCRQVNPETGEPKTVIFVDDKQKNVDEANKRSGWIGIRFTSLEQLKHDLTGLGVGIAH